MFAPPICRRRRRNTLSRSARSDEDGGNPTNIAASEASNPTQRCSRRRSTGGDGGKRFPVSPDPTKTAATQRTSQRAKRAIRHSTARSSLQAAGTFVTTPEKDTAEVVEIGLHPVTYPLLFRKRPPFVTERGPPAADDHPTCTAAEAGLGEPVVVRGDLECQARRRSVRVRVAP